MISGGNTGFFLFVALKLYIQTGFAQPKAGRGCAEIMLQESAQVGFIVNIHFEARIAANENLRAGVRSFCKMFREASFSKV